MTGSLLTVSRMHVRNIFVEDRGSGSGVLLCRLPLYFLRQVFSLNPNLPFCLHIVQQAPSLHPSPCLSFFRACWGSELSTVSSLPMGSSLQPLLFGLQ